MRNSKGRKKIGKIGVKCGLAMISCLLFAVPLFACRKTPAEPNNPELLLGFSQIGSESAWRVGNTTDIEEKAEEYGISLMFEDANQKQENQIAAIRRFIAYKVDVIAFSPIVEEGWDNVLTEAKDAGIPVILVDRDVNTSEEGLTACLIGADFYSEGVKDSENINPLMHHVMDGGVRLTDLEKMQLKAFLNTLTDEQFLSNPDYSDPNH